MEDVYEDHYRYSTACARRNRDDYSAVAWFNRMKTQFNLNRPVQYRIPDHSIVGDGWQEIGSTPIRQYHMNYGWGGGSTSGNSTYYYILPTGSSSSAKTASFEFTDFYAADDDGNDSDYA